MLALAAASALGAAACQPDYCPDDESFVVDENGTCAAAARRLLLGSLACRVSIGEQDGPSGLPPLGARGAAQRPMRQGDFILYGELCGSGMMFPCPEPTTFRLCRAQRVEFRLELACVDASGAPACDAVLTEPNPL